MRLLRVVEGCTKSGRCKKLIKLLPIKERKKERKKKSEFPEFFIIRICSVWWIISLWNAIYIEYGKAVPCKKKMLCLSNNYLSENLRLTVLLINFYFLLLIIWTSIWATQRLVFSNAISNYSLTNIILKNEIQYLFQYFEYLRTSYHHFYLTGVCTSASRFTTTTVGSLIFAGFQFTVYELHNQ